MIGTHVGHYEVVEQIGEGGMGVVYRALDRKLRRSVALKVLTTEADLGSERRKRFLREARVGSAVVHPGIVTVYDFISHDGQEIIVMEYVPGVSLGTFLEQGALPWRTAVRYALAIASAVQAAHDLGIIHRDLKPANILVNPEGWLKVFDFGVSSLTPKSELLDGLTTLTSDEIPDRPLSGTLLYMSPEQTLGEGLDLRSDIFSFGIVLYEMLCGQRPFQAETSLTYLYQLHYEPFLPITDFNPDVPPALSALTGACLERDRQRRPQDLKEVVSRLEEIQSSLGEATQDPPVQPTASQPSGSLRRHFKIAVIALVILGLSVLLWHSAWNRSGIAASGAVKNVARTSTTSNFDLYNQAWADLQRFDHPGNLESAIEAFERVVASGEMQAAAHAGLARAYWRRFRWQSFDRHWLERATEVARRAVELNEDLAEAQISWGLVQLESGHLESAKEALEYALRLDSQNPEGYFAQARLHMAHNDDEAAQAAFRRAQNAGKDDRELYDLWGTLHYRYGRYQEAANAFRRSIERAPNSTIGYRNLAATYYKLDLLGEAAAELQKALALEPSSGLYTNLGTLYFNQGLFAESAAAFGKALKLPGGSNRFISWGNFADACRQIPGRQEEAKDAYLRAIQLLDAKAKDGGTLKFNELSRRSLFLARRGDHGEALTTLQQLEPDAWRNPNIQFRAAITYELAGRRDDALEALREALKLGYSRREVQRDPDLLALREDLRYHQIFIDLEKATEPSEAG